MLLDPIHYGGGLTSFDGLSLNKPIVTLPGNFSRGRFTYGFYRTMGVDECIAADPEDYVARAVRLGTDAEWRATRDRPNPANERRAVRIASSRRGLRPHSRTARRGGGPPRLAGRQSRQGIGMTPAVRLSADLHIPVARESASADRCRQSAIALQKQGRLEDAIHLYLRGLATRSE